MKKLFPIALNLIFPEALNIQCSKRSTIRTFIIVIVAFLWMNTVGFAQRGQEIEDKVVVIEKDAKIELPALTRNFERANILTESAKPKPQEYVFTNVNVVLPNITAKIRVPTIPPDPIIRLYGNYIKAGFGNYITPYLEGFFNSKRSDHLNYGVHVKHLSSRSGPVKSKEISSLSGTSLNSIEGYVKYFAEAFTVKSGLDFKTQKINYYGFDQQVLNPPGSGMEVLSDSIRQRYNQFSIYTTIQNIQPTDQFGYHAGIRFNYLNSKLGAREAEIVIAAQPRYALQEDQSIGADLDLAFSGVKTLDKATRQFVQLKPFYKFRKDKVDLTVGINVGYSNDTIKAYNKLHFYPRLHTELQVVDKVFRAFAGIDGELQKNTLRGFVSENPFISPYQRIYNSSKAIELYIGGKGDLGGKINYLTTLSYQNIKNLYLYNNSRSDTSKFSILYAQGSSSVFQFLADLSYEVTNKCRISLSNKFIGYTVKSDSLEAWHRPSLVTSINSSYNLYDKIYFNADFFYIGGLKARRYGTNGEEDIKLPAPIDLNLKADYRFSQVFSAFIEFNNLFNRKYQLYQYYPVKGINILAGVTYSF